MKTDIRSEFGELEGVILHTPGPEVENMTPETAERALYSDILNLTIAGSEYAQLANLLNAVTTTCQVRDLLETVLAQAEVRNALIARVCDAESCQDIYEALGDLPPDKLAEALIQGVLLPRDTLTRFLSRDRFLLTPLHNFFFTRDAAMVVGEMALIGRMAKSIRARESLIMAAVFQHSPAFSIRTVNPADQTPLDPAVSIEGGDVLVAREDILIIGNGSRTSSQGIDFIIAQMKRQGGPERHILVQELPSRPESFIHLDMVFTLLSPEHCMVFAPLMCCHNKYHTIHIFIENGRVTRIREEKRLIDALRDLGMDLTPLYCGGRKDPWVQEREQWHSAANFFALAPGKVVGYDRNIHTIDELSQHGFEIVPADAIIDGRRHLADFSRCVVTLSGSELPRGGGGARCMTLPVRRKPVAC